MKTRIYTIRHNGYTLRVTATFYPATIQTMEQPGEPATADITSVRNIDSRIYPSLGIEILDQLTDADFAALESEWLNRWFEDERDYYTDEN